MQEPMTEVLKRLETDPEAARIVFDAYFEIARKYALSHISPKFQGRISGTDIANSGMFGAIRAAAGRSDITTQEFKALLLAVVRNKAASAIRGAIALKNSVDKEVPFEPALHEGRRGLCSMERVMINEVVEHINAFIEAESKPVRQTIYRLYFMEDREPKEILTLIQSRVKLRTIQATLKTAVAQLRRQFGVEEAGK